MEVRAMESKVAPQAAVVDVGSLRLERHARRAFEEAWKLSGGRPLAAAHLLKAAIAVGGSEAFTTLATLLPWTDTSPATPTEVPPANLNAIAFERPLAESFYIAEGFLASTDRAVWGRDYVTLALLANDDPSLREMVSEAGTTIEDVRRGWLQFVRDSKRHRTADEWERWWRAAGVASPSETNRPATANAAYLLTWNPARYRESEMASQLDHRDDDGIVSFGWSSGNNQSMEVGDRVFLLRQGQPSKRGLVGVGTVATPPKEQPHWDERQRLEGKKSLIVRVRWEAIGIEPIVELSRLVALTGETKLWATQVGGASIDPQIWDRLEAIWSGAWQRREHDLEPVRVPDLEPRRLIARFDPDRGIAPDSLNIHRYVDAFARIAASRTLVPPMSVGLFGDWGSGKTFFMDRVHENVKMLTSGAEDGSEHLYLRNVCQMRFNAWHYAETDLWASLVSTIFKELRIHLDGPADDADDFNRLLNQLEIATELRKEAKQRLDNAREQLRTAQSAVEEADKKLQQLPALEPPSDEELKKILKETVTEASGTPVDELSKLLLDAYELTGNEEFKRVKEGVETGKTTVEEAKVLLDDTRALVSRAGFWWRLLATAKLHRTPVFWALIVAAVAIPILVVVVQSRVDFGIGWSAGLLEALTVLGAIVAWARSTLARATPVFNRLDAVQAKIERRIEEAQTEDRRNYEKEKANALKNEEQTKRAVATARAALDAASNEVRAAEVALRDSTSEARLGRFIRERAASADYDKYLGLIAMIHRDFNQLSKLMDQGHSDQADLDLPRVDRIILYIDDLDRCYPPERVVRVLEAVHLLLFFPLFVVFVGVDSRWVSRALNCYYERMLSDESLQVGTGGSPPQQAPANSQDFLEKIFQVPFWLRRMDPPAVQRMIHSLITPDEVEPAIGQLDVELAGDGGPPPDLGDDEELNSVTDSSEPGKAAAQLVASEAESHGETIGEPIAPPTEALRISQVELDFMDQVAPLMPRTPRAIKRFVNIYRLYKVALSTPALGKFLGTPEHPGNFRAVQILLALVIGAPDFAKAVVTVLDELDETNSKRLSDLGALFEDPQEPTWQTTIQALGNFAQGNNNLQLQALREVSPLVTRYSVHHMVSALPGESTLG
jgi:hypothetical protein